MRMNVRLKPEGSDAEAVLAGGLSADCKVPSGVFCIPAMLDELFLSNAGSTVVP